MKRVIYIIATITVLALLVLGAIALKDNIEIKDENNTKVQVITTLFPQYDFVKQIGKDKVEVNLLLPPGVESHIYEPTANDIIKINKSNLFAYTGENMEPWVSSIIQNVDANKVNILDISKGIALIQNEDHDHDDEETEGENEHSHEYDPHIWLDPALAMQMVNNITESLAKIDPENQGFYENNAKEYKKQLAKLDEDINSSLKEKQRDTLVFGSRFAFTYFAKRYDLKYISAYASCGAETDPSVKAIADIIEYIKENDIPVIYYEEFLEAKVANSISLQTGVKTVMLSSMHNVSSEQLQENVTYIDLMYKNLEGIKQGLI